MLEDQRQEAQLLVNGTLLGDIEEKVQRRLFDEFCKQEDGNAHHIREKMSVLNYVIGEIRSLAARAIDTKERLNDG